MDALVAERVLGLKLVKSGSMWDHGRWVDENQKVIYDRNWDQKHTPELPSFSRDDTAAIKLLLVNHEQFYLNNFAGTDKFHCGLKIPKNPIATAGSEAHGDTIAHAICLAAIRATGFFIDET